MTSTNAIEASAALSLAEVAEVAGVALPAGADARRLMRGAAALEGAQADQIAYMDNAKYADALAATRAGPLVVTRLYPGALRPQSRRRFDLGRRVLAERSRAPRPIRARSLIHYCLFLIRLRSSFLTTPLPVSISLSATLIAPLAVGER